MLLSCSFSRAFIDFLVDNGTPIRSFHLMGHSAGSHVAGQGGASVTRGRIPRITGNPTDWKWNDFLRTVICLVTGLDPTDATLWLLNDPSTRLDVSDGEFVDIIHTNGGDVHIGEVAFDAPIGHVDFYVSGGHKQPGCPEPPEDNCKILSKCFTFSNL